MTMRLSWCTHSVAELVEVTIVKDYVKG